MRTLLFCFLFFATTVRSQVQYADVLVDTFYSGSNPDFAYFYGAKDNSSLDLINPNVCLGNTPWFVCIPKNSFVVVGFIDNLIFDAPNQNDIFIQEIGKADELANVYVSSDFGASFTFFGKINGGTTNGIDLNDIGYTGLVNAVKIEGLDNKGSAPGFDLARVYGIRGANCSAKADTILPIFCLDQALNLTEIYGGTWDNITFVNDEFVAVDTGRFLVRRIVDDVFEVCPSDTAMIDVRITACDCLGIPYGTRELDACNQCLDPLDPLFGLSCLDCTGTPFGTAILDICNQCLQPDDPRICTSAKLFHIPNAFSPNSDGFNEVFGIEVRSGVEAEVLEYSIYGRWGQLVYQQKNFPVRSSSHWWDGRLGDVRLPSGVYLYHFRVQIANGEILEYSGDVTLLR